MCMLVLKARCLGGFALCNFFLYRLGVPEQALGGIPLGFGIDKPDDNLSDMRSPNKGFAYIQCI